MEPITLNKNSYHFRLANVYGDLRERDILSHISICEYIKCVVKGFFKTLVITGAIGLALVGIIDFIMYIAMSIFIAPVGDLHVLGIFGAAIFSGVVVIPCIIGGLTLLDHLQEKRRNTPKFHKQSFIGLAFRSIKNKICFNVNFK